MSVYILSDLSPIAGVAQLAERHLPKVNVVSSNLIARYVKALSLWQ